MCEAVAGAENLFWMKEIVKKVSRGGDLVIDPCASTFAIANVCIL